MGVIVGDGSDVGMSVGIRVGEAVGVCVGGDTKLVQAVMRAKIETENAIRRTMSLGVGRIKQFYLIKQNLLPENRQEAGNPKTINRPWLF